MSGVGCAAAGGKLFLKGWCRKDTDQSIAKKFRTSWIDENDPRICDGRPGFPVLTRDHRNRGRNSRYRTAPAGGNTFAHKKQNIAFGKSAYHDRWFEDSFHRQLHGTITEALT